MKYLFTLITIVSSFCGFSQDYTTFSIISKGFVISDHGHEAKVAKTIQLTYNSQQTLLYIEGEGVKTFRNINYSNTLENGGWYNESWISDETPTTDYGHWGINVQKLKTGTLIQIIFRNEVTYYASKTIIYTEGGKVTQNAIVKNWKELFAKQKTKDSLISIINLAKVQKIEQDNKDDSLLHAYPYMEIKTIETILAKNIYANVTASNNKGWHRWTIKIDWLHGIVIDACPDKYYEGFIVQEDKIPLIKKSLIGQLIGSLPKGATKIDTSFSHVNFIL